VVNLAAWVYFGLIAALAAALSPVLLAAVVVGAGSAVAATLSRRSR
jgi:hypothetical protein